MKTRMPVAGLWSSADGIVRLALHPDGTYAGTVAGRRKTAYGTYHVDGETVTLSDHDSGLYTPVQMRDGALDMAGHRLIPAAEEPRPSRRSFARA